MNFPGADVIARKMPRLIARRLVGHESRWGHLARHEWLSLARDHIGAWDENPTLLGSRTQRDPHKGGLYMRKGTHVESSLVGVFPGASYSWRCS